MPKNDTKKDVHVKIKRTSILIVFVILSFFLGRYSYYLESGSLPADLMLEPGKTYQQGVNEVKNAIEKKLESEGIIPQSIMYINNATIKSINGQSIIVEFDASNIDLLKEGRATKTVFIKDGVKIVQQIQNSPEEMEKMYDELKNQKSNADIIEPSPFAIKELKFSDLKVGDVISVNSTTDVRKSDTIEAVSIQLLSQ